MITLIKMLNHKDNKSLVIFSLSIFVLLEIVSIMAWRWPLLGSIATVFLVLGWLLLSLRNLPLAITWLIAELIVGSFGYLFSFNIGSIDLSLRLCLFLAAFAVMVFRIASNRQHIIFKHTWSWWYVGAIFALVWATARGYYHWNSLGNLFLDLNGYLYILLLPLILEAYEEVTRENIYKYVKTILTPAIAWLSLRTVLLLYLFTHIESEYLIWVYKWYRDSGLGEITPAGGGFWRIFSQSHLYSSIATVSGFAWLWHQWRNAKKIKPTHPVIIITLISLVGLVASLSRSLWLGAAIAWMLVPLVSFTRNNIKYLAVYLFFSIILISSAAGAVLAVSRFNWPLKPLSQASAQAFANRFEVEPAGQARLNLWSPLFTAAKIDPIWGAGFGSVVAYYSTDPRAVQATAGGSGLTVTYAFEWGWLDFWYKFGLVALILYSAWLILPVWRGFVLWRRGEWLGFSGLVLIALYLTHFTTPYLNHPLGLGAVMVLGAFTLKHKFL